MWQVEELLKEKKELLLKLEAAEKREKKLQDQLDVADDPSELFAQMQEMEEENAQKLKQQALKHQAELKEMQLQLRNAGASKGKASR